MKALKHATLECPREIVLIQCLFEMVVAVEMYMDITIDILGHYFPEFLCRAALYALVRMPHTLTVVISFDLLVSVVTFSDVL